jgi:hypothetical protein
MITVTKRSVAHFHVTYPKHSRDVVASIVDYKRIRCDMGPYVLPGDSGREMLGLVVDADDAGAIAVVEGLAKK